ncbi:phage head-tail connector protein [Psychrobacillus sp. FSL K6-2365]|uniref:phage head-tail connector protein n=1 Tax=Psychrobacillus sp. FSL K6-2365 TaxID=2921546 RepID=UPI0030F9748F
MALTSEQTNSILSDVKNFLRVTWNEEDEELTRMIRRSMAYFKSITGAELDYVVDERAKDLLLERCRYVYNRSAEEFENNFRHELLNLQFRVAVDERRERLESET